MKKLMIAAVAALAMVSAAQANTTGYAKFTNYAQVDKTPSSEATSTGKYSCYLIINSVDSATALETWLKNNGGITRENIVKQCGAAVTWNAIAWNAGTYEAVITGSDTLGGRDAVHTYAIVLAAMTSESSDFGYEIMKGVMNPKAPTVMEDATFTFDDAAAGTVKWTAAPEPTSGLLLLLGVAGLALKRKRA